MLNRITRIAGVAAIVFGGGIAAAQADCHSHNHNTGTVVGAVGGGAVGSAVTHGSLGGVVAGAVIGGLAGNAISRDADCRHDRRSAYYYRNHHRVYY
jgi:uncharacterized protein YcfJ